ncbi:hypothetical protein JCM5353_001295 [Sporobolomyces roseus]
MAPIDPPPAKDKHSLPSFHLKALRLEERGCELFFANVHPKQTLQDAARKVLRTLYPEDFDHASPPPRIRSVTLFLDGMEGVAYTCSSAIDEQHKEIHISTGYLEGVYDNSGKDEQRLKHEIEGVLTHEMVHVFQLDGSGSAPGGLIEGIADWVRHENHLDPPHWREGPSEDENWDAGYQTTGFFLAWLSKRSHRPHLVPRLNSALLKNSWSEDLLTELVGSTDSIEKLWETYKRSLDRSKEDSPPLPIPTHSYRPSYRG